MKSLSFKYLFPLLFMSLNFLFANPLFANEELLKRTQMLMGTYVSISLSEKNNQHISNSFKLIKEIENSLSSYDPKASVSRLNKTHKIAINQNPRFLIMTPKSIIFWQ